MTITNNIGFRSVLHTILGSLIIGPTHTLTMTLWQMRHVNFNVRGVDTAASGRGWGVGYCAKPFSHWQSFIENRVGEGCRWKISRNFLLHLMLANISIVQSLTIIKYTIPSPYIKFQCLSDKSFFLFLHPVVSSLVEIIQEIIDLRPFKIQRHRHQPTHKLLVGWHILMSTTSSLLWPYITITVGNFQYLGFAVQLVA